MYKILHMIFAELFDEMKQEWVLKPFQGDLLQAIHISLSHRHTIIHFRKGMLCALLHMIFALV